MSLRVRYRNVSENVQESNQVFNHPSNGARYKVRVSGVSWSILDAGTETVALNGTSDTKTKLQKEVRNALVSLGVTLSTEKRKPRSTVTV